RFRQRRRRHSLGLTFSASAGAAVGGTAATADATAVFASAASPAGTFADFPRSWYCHHASNRSRKATVVATSRAITRRKRKCLEAILGVMFIERAQELNSGTISMVLLMPEVACRGRCANQEAATALL